MWVLIITVWFSASSTKSYGPAIAITNIPGYSSEAACRIAAKRVRESGGEVKAMCVPGPDKASK